MICEANKIIAEFPLGAYVAKCPTMTVTDLQKATDTSLVHVVDLDAEAARTPKSGGLTTKNPVVREQIEDL
jgi:hypothetical protein